MASKPYIAGPDEVEPGGGPVELTLENPPSGTEQVRWSSQPASESLTDSTDPDEAAEWEPGEPAESTAFTIQAEALDGKDARIATISRTILVCGPAIELVDGVPVAGGEARYVFRARKPATGFAYFCTINRNRLAVDAPVVPGSEFTVEKIPAGPFRLQIYKAPYKTGGAIPRFSQGVLLKEIVTDPVAKVEPATPVTLRRADLPPTPDQILWVCIRNSTRHLSFANFQTFLDVVFCGDIALLCDPDLQRRRRFLIEARARAKDSGLRLPFPGVDPYRLLKAAAEVFVTSSCGVLGACEAPASTSEERSRGVDIADFPAAYQAYLDSDEDPRPILPYMALVLRRLGVPLVRRVVDAVGDGFEICEGVLQERLAHPCLIELIWSYWHEEAMLAQCMNAISQRFQNLRAPGRHDPLSQLEIDPLRPLNNLLWGYVQDEVHRLSVLRRCHEYEHHYGMPLIGKALGRLRTADTRSKFVESFHNLLYQALQFYRQDDDTTVLADAFPVLNALKETHYLLAQGAHNQFGDLPSTSRQEMLIEQWLLARPEMREFLGGRVMVPYPEPWMDKVDAVKTLKGWTDVSVVHFHDLAVFGEQIVLSVRYGAWSVVNDPTQAANWARYWRPEVQGYVHGYRAVAGVDIAADVTDQQQLMARAQPPSVHLQGRLAHQLRSRPVAGTISAGRVTAQVVATTRTALPAGAPRLLTRGGQ
jgi:hypothetical protein